MCGRRRPNSELFTDPQTDRQTLIAAAATVKLRHFLCVEHVAVSENIYDAVLYDLTLCVGVTLTQ